MQAKVLVVSNEADSAMKIISELALDEINIVFVDKASQAIANVRKNQYDLIVLGDKLGAGDTYDVGMELKDSKNYHKAIICVGHNAAKRAKLIKLMSPYAISGHDKDLKAAVEKTVAYFKDKKKEV